MSRIKSMVFNDQMEYLEDILEESSNEACAAKQIEINQLGKENENIGNTNKVCASISKSANGNNFCCERCDKPAF